MADEPLLALRGVSLAFGGLKVVSDLDLQVAEGEIVSVIGPNGAGKTTLFNLITGIYQPDDGDIVFDGRSILGLEPHQITRLGIARTFQTLRLFLNMSVRENVMAAAYGRTKAGVVRSMLRTPGHAAGGGGDPRAWPRSSSRSSASGSRATAGISPPTASRTPIAGGSRSRARWRPGRRSCCSTSRPPA